MDPFIQFFSTAFFFLGLLSTISATSSETITSSTNFLDSGLVAVGALAAYFTTISRGRLDFEIGLRHFTVANAELKIDASGYKMFSNYVDPVGAIVIHGRHVNGGDDAAAFNALIDYLVIQLALEVHVLTWDRLTRDHLIADDQGSAQSINVDCIDDHQAAQGHRCACKVAQATLQHLSQLGNLEGLNYVTLLSGSTLIICKACTEAQCHKNMDRQSSSSNMTHSINNIRDQQNINVEEEARAVRTWWDATLEGIEEFLHGPAEELCMHRIIVQPRRDSPGVLTWLIGRSLDGKDSDNRGTLHSAVEAVTAADTRMEEGGSSSFSWESLPWGVSITYIVGLILTLSFVLVLHMDGFSAALATRRFMVSYVSDKTGTFPHLGHFVRWMRIGYGRKEGDKDKRAEIERIYIGQDESQLRCILLWRYLMPIGELIAIVMWAIIIGSGFERPSVSNMYSSYRSSWPYFIAAGACIVSTLCNLCSGRNKTLPMSRMRAVQVAKLLVMGTSGWVFIAGLEKMRMSSSSDAQVMMKRIAAAVLGLICVVQWWVGCMYLTPRLLTRTPPSVIERLTYGSSFLLLASLAAVSGRWK